MSNILHFPTKQPVAAPAASSGPFNSVREVLAFVFPECVAYQPGRGNWIFHEDGDGPEVGRNNDLWSCLEDGRDDDKLSDGCVRIGTLNDLNAEWTGGVFDATGERFFVSIQHNVTGHGVILEITGWQRGDRDDDGEGDHGR